MNERATSWESPVVIALTIVVALAFCCAFPFSGEEAHADGIQWKQYSSVTSNDLTDVFMLDSNHGWAVGKKGTILSYDGSSWTDRSSSITGDNTTKDLYTVVAFDENDVWALGDNVEVHYNTSTNKWNATKVGEKFWGACVVPSTRGVPPEKYKGWATADSGNFYYYDGSAWIQHHKNGLAKFCITANAEATWVGGHYGGVYKWTEETDWKEIRYHFKHHDTLKGISVCRNPKLLEKNRVLVVGDNGDLLYSEHGDLFHDFKNDTTRVSTDLKDVDFLDTSNVWAVGKGGTLLFGTNPPDDWTPLTIKWTGDTRDLYGVSALDAYHAWAVGDKGTILYSVPPPRITGCNVQLSLLNRVVQGKKYNVSITGSDTHFTDQSQAQFGQGIQVETSFKDSTHVSASITVAGDAQIGKRDVNVITGSETPIAKTDAISVVAAPPAPTLDKLEPDHGTVGTSVTLTGKNFGASQGLSSNVTFNGKKAHNYSSWSEGQIVVDVPSGASNGPVVVKTSNGTSNSKSFTVDEPQVPTITGCYPNSVAQGDAGLVSIHGSYTHFEDGTSQAVFSPEDGVQVNGTTVLNSSVAVASITVDSDATLGTRSVNVITGSETPTALDGHFTVVPDTPGMPVLDSLSITRGSPGDEVTLSGQNFGDDRGSSHVSFNGVEAVAYASWADTSITCAVPEGAMTGPVNATTSIGTSGGILFTVGEPYIKDCDPTGAVQGHTIDRFKVKGDYTHFEQGKSTTVVSGSEDGIQVGTTNVSDSTHASTSLEVDPDAEPGTRDINVITGSENPAALKNVFTVYEAPSSPPELYSVAPGSGQVGSMVYIKGVNFGEVRGSSSVTFDGVPVTTYLSWRDYEVVCRVPLGATRGMVSIQTPWGNSNELHYGVDNPTFYFAEGTARPGYEPYLCVQNPGNDEAGVKITYMKGDGTTEVQEMGVPAATRMTVNAKETLGEADDLAHDFSTKVESTSGGQIIVERPMYFNYNGAWPGGSDVMGALSPAPYFFFAEGSCRPGLNPYITIQNPGDTDATVKVIYLKGDGTTADQEFAVPPTSRKTVNVKEILGEGDDVAHDFSAVVEATGDQWVIAERPTYFDYHGAWPGGHDVVGSVVPERQFYFAEGTARPGFDPYICIQNPCKSEASVLITYMRGDGTTWEQSLEVPANSRFTVNAKGFLGEGDNPAYDFSCKVECTNNLWIIAERPIYFNYQATWPGGSDVVGAYSPATAYFFAEGTTRPGFDPYITIQNPGIAHEEVKVTYMLGDGSTREEKFAVLENSRYTLRAIDTLGTGDDVSHDFSIKVETSYGEPIIVERPTYFNYHGMWPGGHDVVGFSP